MPDSAPVTMDATDAFKAEMQAYEASRAPAPAPASAANAVKEVPPAVEAANVGTDADKTAVSTDQVAPAANAQAPVEVEAVDLSYLPEDVRPEITVKSPEVAKRLKSMVMGHKAVTQGLQEVAQIKRDAANWQAATADPEKARKIVQILTGQEEAAAEVEEAVSPLDLDGPGLLALIDKRSALQAKKEVHGLVETQAAPLKHRDQINAALTQVAQTRQLPTETLQAAVALWKQDLAEEGMDISTVSPAQVPALIAPYLRLTRAAPPKTAQTNGTPAGTRTAGLSEVASPNGRTGVASGSTVVVPPHIREGRPPLTNAEHNAEYEYAFHKRFGPDANPG